EFNMAQAAILTNLGVSLSDMGLILNSPAAKLISDLNRNNSSMFHSKVTQTTIKRDAYQILLRANWLMKDDKVTAESKKKLENYIEQAKKSFQRSKKFKIPKAKDATINTSTLDQFESQFAVLEL